MHIPFPLDHLPMAKNEQDPLDHKVEKQRQETSQVYLHVGWKGELTQGNPVPGNGRDL